MRRLELISIFISFSLILLLSIESSAQQTNQEDKPHADWLEHIEKGEANKLGAHFAPMISLELPSQNGDFNKNQAVAILSSFFSKHPATKVTIKQSGTSSSMRAYFIGDYSCADQTYRLYVNTHLLNSKQTIHSLRITKK
jgi:hypothetical protein